MKHIGMLVPLQTISIKIDADILAVLQLLGKDYQTRINTILRKDIMTGDY